MLSGFQTQTLRANTPPSVAPAPALKIFGDDGLTFRDVIDLVNPLHHLPIIGNLYRRITGDIIDPAIRIAGGALFGGPLGAGFAAVSIAVKEMLEFSDEAVADRGTIDKRRPDSRGGWMVAATRVVNGSRVPDLVAVALELGDAPARVRRGGWMVQAAYAMADARARSGGDGMPRARIDTTA